MTDARWAEVERVFAEALDQPEAERGAFLDRACAHDAPLRAEVDGLLRQLARSGGVLSAPAAEWARRVAAGSLAAGQRLGHYEVQELIGAGGMGEVYLGRDVRLLRQVALKLLPEGLARDGEWARRFEREARALGALNHPNVVTVHDVGEAFGRRWMATEFVAGTTLRERMAQEHLPVPEALSIFRQVLAALAAAHEAGVVHRDVKPENIMVRPDGLVKLLDFGLAKALGPDPGLTADGARFGTLRYMSPEQLDGGEVGRASDVWSAGVVLAEMLTGTHPFPGPTPAHAVVAIHEGTPRLPDDVPFRAVLQRALARSPAARYAGAGEMLAALEAARPRHFSARRWWRPAAVVAVLGMVALSTPWLGQRGEPFQKTQVRRLATLTRGQHAALSPDGAFMAYTDEQAGRRTLWLQQLNGSAPRLVPADAPHGFAGIGFSADGYLYYAAYDESRFGRLYRLPLVGGEPRFILRDIDSPPAFAPDGTRLAFLRHDNRRGATALVLAATDGSAERVLAERRTPLAFSTAGCAWSPDGRGIVVSATVNDPNGAARAGLLEVDTDSGAVRERAAGRFLWIGSVAAAGAQGFVFPAVVVGSQTAQIVLRSWSDDERVIDTASAQGGYLRVSASADGRQMLVVHRDREVQLMLAERERLDAPRRVPAASGAFYDLAFGPPPDLLAQLFTGVRPGLVRIARDGSFQPLLAANRMARSPATSPAGDAIVFVAEHQGIDQIWRVDATGAAAMPLTSGAGRASAPACCTPDGRVVYLSQAAGYPTLWSVPLRPGGAPRQLSTRPALAPTLDATGTRLAWVDLERPDAVARQVVVAPIEDLERRTAVPAVPPESQFRFSPGGEALTFVRSVDGVSNLWEAPTGGGAPQPLTSFSELTIFGFDWSRDGREAVLLRGHTSHHLLLIGERKE